MALEWLLGHVEIVDGDGHPVERSLLIETHGATGDAVAEPVPEPETTQPEPEAEA
jgi:hypothetical protein